VTAIKTRRQELILQAVEQGAIATQEQLLDYLRGKGIDATQATVSRDMKELRLRKAVRRGGRAVYEVAPARKEDDSPALRKYRAILSGAVEGVDGAGNIVCVRCGPGMAQGACAAIDALPIEGIVGTLAGDDTIFLLCRAEEYMLAVQEEIRNYAAELND